MNNIIILGGGSAGWMTASTLIKCFPNKKITLMESPNIPTIGVGEGTLAHIRNWQALVGIKDKDFMSACDATYKLSIKFTNFYKKGESFHYPFGKPYLQGNELLMTDWWFKKFLYPKTPYSDYATCNYPQMALVNENKCFFDTDKTLPAFEFHKHTGFGFDAIKFGLWLRDHVCIPAGVKHIKEEIKTIEQDEDGIKTLNGKHKADLFIDCTGFKSFLLEQTMKVPFINMENILPNNTAWCTRIPYTNKRKQLVGYTHCTAVKNGWIWNIPLWSRMGSGYVYSNKFISDEDALKEFQKHLGTKELDFKKINFRVGIHDRLWVKNVCAIGLAAGFVEPLEANGLFSVHEFIHQLVRTLQRPTVSQWDKDVFTSLCKKSYDTFYGFVAMHYALSHRQDTPYWKSNFNRKWSEELSNLLPSLYLDMSVPPSSGIHCIAAGMHWGPIDIPSLVKENVAPNMDGWKKKWKATADRLDKRKNEWKKAVKDAPIMYDFLKKHSYHK